MQICGMCGLQIGPKLALTPPKHWGVTDDTLVHTTCVGQLPKDVFPEVPRAEWLAASVQRITDMGCTWERGIPRAGA